MTSKPDSVGTLGCHWTGHTGRPLEPQVQWNATGTTLADASAQWCSSGDPLLICIIGTHWKTTGKPLEDHWYTTGSTLAFLQWHSSVHWGLSSRHTGLPLEDHWLRVRGLTSVNSTVYSGTDQRKHRSSASLAFLWGIHRGPVNSPHKWPVTRKMFPFHNVIMHML